MSRDGRTPGFARQWHWATQAAEAVLATRDLSQILRFYRRMHGISQTELGTLLGYDKTYISLLEGQKRALADVGSLRKVSERLGLPPHTLGVTTAADTDHQLIVQLGESTVRLAEVARQSGHATEAVAELWPLVARLEARVADGHAERETLHLLGQARVGLGVALGNVLPEERLSTAARWTGKAIEIADYFAEPRFTSLALRMHGNELRKAGLHGAAVNRLAHAAATAPDAATRAAALPLLARAAGTLGNAPLFDRVIREADATLDQIEHTSLVNPFSLHEIRLRGLLDTGRAETAIRLAEQGVPPGATMAPQWRVIEMITIASVQIQAADRHAARQTLAAALQEAVRQRLPHQVQRIIRVAAPHLPETRAQAAQSLEAIRTEMAA